MGSQAGRPFICLIMIAMLLFVGVGGFVSGVLLLLSTDGRLMGMSVDILANSPFEDYLIPAIILLIFLGILPIIAGYGLMKLPRWKWAENLNLFKSYRWPWMASILSGVVILGWLAVETILYGYISFLQPVMAVWAAIIILVAFLPGVRSYLHTV